MHLCRNPHTCALQERWDIWRKAGKTVTGDDQMKDLTKSGRRCRSVAAKGLLPDASGRSQAVQALQGFWRRVKAGENPGYSRQGRDRYDSICSPYPGFSVSGKCAVFPEIGNIRLRLHRPLEDEVT